MYMMKQKGPCVPSDQNAFASSLKGGEIQPVSVKVGDKVLLPEYGGTKVVLDDKVSRESPGVQSAVCSCSSCPDRWFLSLFAGLFLI